MRLTGEYRLFSASGGSVSLQGEMLSGGLYRNDSGFAASGSKPPLSRCSETVLRGLHPPNNANNVCFSDET